MNEYELKARSEPPQSFRLTGRDGPPGSKMIPGAPAWLARGTPVYISYVFFVARFAYMYLNFYRVRSLNVKGVPPVYITGSCIKWRTHGKRQKHFISSGIIA